MAISMSAPDPQRTAITCYDLSAGGRPAAWRLPADQTCANAARAHVQGTLTPMGLSDDLIHSAATVAGELAANAFVHVLSAQPIYVGGPGLPELWIHLGEDTETRLVVSVFDADRRHEPILRAPTEVEETGRGMRIVAALSAQWGCRLSRARVGPEHVAGKAVWAALPLPADVGRRIRRGPSPTDAAEVIRAALADRGIRRVHRSGDGRLQVLSVRAGLTVWVGETIYWRRDHGGYTHRRLNDLSDAIEHIVARHEALALSPDGHA